MKELILKINADEIKEGINFIKDIIVSKKNNELKAIKNSCLHQGGRFSKLSNKELICHRHGWVFDIEDMTYTNPVCKELNQKALTIHHNTLLNQYEFYDKKSIDWQNKIGQKTAITKGELEITYYTHACIEVKCKEYAIFTDPWLTGPCFQNGWWLKDKPPKTWREKIKKANCIYISHNHSDHLHYETLDIIYDLNPDILFILPNFKSKSCEKSFQSTRFKNYKTLDFCKWYDINKDLKLMILNDYSGRDDSGLLINYKGHTILNTVDSSNNLNGGDYPKVDVLLSGYSTIASGYPICWQDLYPEREMKKRINKVIASTKKEVVSHIQNSSPKLFIPFASSADILHPDDFDLSKITCKLQPERLCNFLSKFFKNIKFLNPKPGCIIDVSSLTCQDNLIESTEDHQFEKYTKLIQGNLNANKLTNQDVIDFLKNSKFKDNLVLHIIETDNCFIKTYAEHLFDFKTNCVIKKRPARVHRYLRLKVRKHILRNVIANSLPLEEISIGFQGRFYREPDVYNMNFWNHFQNIVV